MEDVMIVLIVMSTVFGLPIVALSAVTLGIARMWHGFKLAELDVRRVEAATRVHQARLLAGAPDWLDPSNPREVEAWQRAHVEVVQAAARAHALS